MKFRNLQACVIVYISQLNLTPYFLNWLFELYFLYGLYTLTLAPSPRVALLKKSGEEDWRNRINKKQDVVKIAVDEQHAQLWEVEQSFKKKVTT